MPQHLRAWPLRVAFRHFPVRSKPPRVWAAASGAESAALQGAFWPMHDALFADQGRLEDPHLWARAERLGLDVGRFDADRRSDPVVARVREQLRSGVRDQLRWGLRAAVVTTPSAFADARLFAGRDPGLFALLD